MPRGLDKQPKRVYNPVTLSGEGVTLEVRVRTEDLSSVANAAKELGRPRVTIYRWIEAGKIVGIKLGGILFIPKSEVERLKNEKAAEPVKTQQP